MNKILLVFLTGICALVPLLSAAATEARRPRLPAPTPTPAAARIVNVETDQNELILFCPTNPDCGSDKFSVEVKTIVDNPKKLPLLYSYTVSGGRIVGQGEKVFWNLEGVRPGEYTVTAAIDYGDGYGETVSRNVRIRQCPVCDLPCSCPTLAVSGGGRTKAGAAVRFRAEVSGGTITEIKYNWTVSQGAIVVGQGTAEITVKTKPGATGTLTATVEIAGDLCEQCRRRASETAEIVK
ncbi:MAG: hypothetical protein JSS81_18955 [Acidobacteria bacterium]|nr:hypothetical protein [Acidobacteriota bacterium]